MTNWRKILGYQIEELELTVGSRVRLRSDRICQIVEDTIPAGTEGVITRLPLILDRDNSDAWYRVKFDWKYPTPSDIGDGGHEMGWGCCKDELEII